ncbi:MAG: leucine-rich repeat protein [Treponema sp.]|nr:leucine-rich repeat protein [Treponema sp.]
MKKLFNYIKISTILTMLAVLSACSGLTENQKPVNDGNSYLRFSVNKFAGRGAVYDPQGFTENDVDEVKLYCKSTDVSVTDFEHDILNSWTFKRTENKNAIQVFEETVINFGNVTNFGKQYYNFGIELCSNELCEEKADGIKVYSPVQTGYLEKVLLVPGWNTLAFETEQYRKESWFAYRSIIDFDYKIPVSSGAGFMTVELKTWPYDYEVWTPDWDYEKREPKGEYYRLLWETSASVNGYLECAGKKYIDDGDYKFDVSIYDTQGGKLLKSFKDIVTVSGYRTKVRKEISLTDDQADKLPYGVLTIDDAYNLCVDYGKIKLYDTTVAQNITYTASLKYKGQELASTANSKLSISDNAVIWSNNIFEGKTAEGGVYNCQLTVNGKTFNIEVPDRKYVSFCVDSEAENYLDPENPPDSLKELTGNYLLHLYGTGATTYLTDDYDENGYRILSEGSLRKYTRMFESLNSDAKVFLDMGEVTGITSTYWSDVITTATGAMLTGIAFPNSLVKVESTTFACPEECNRHYELTVVLGSNITEIWSLSRGDDWMYQPNNQDKRPFYNMFKKFIVHNNPNLKVFQDGSLLVYIEDNGWSRLIASADVIEELKIPIVVKKIEDFAFSGNKKLKSIADWGTLKEIAYGAFYASELEGDIVLGSNISFVERWAFYGTKITSLTISESVRLLYYHCIPDNAYIGYEKGSTTRHYWNWISKDEFDEAESNDEFIDLVGAIYGNNDFPETSGEFRITDWESKDIYKYANYTGLNNFNKRVFWRID